MFFDELIRDSDNNKINDENIIIKNEGKNKIKERNGFYITFKLFITISKKAKVSVGITTIINNKTSIPSKRKNGL